MCHTFSVMLYNKFDMLIVFGGAKYNIIVWYCFCCWSHIMLNKWLEHGASSKPVLCAQTFVYFNVHGNGTCKMYYRVCTQHNTNTTREFIYIYYEYIISMYVCVCVSGWEPLLQPLNPLICLILFIVYHHHLYITLNGRRILLLLRVTLHTT